VRGGVNLELTDRKIFPSALVVNPLTIVFPVHSNAIRGRLVMLWVVSLPILIGVRHVPQWTVLPSTSLLVEITTDPEMFRWLTPIEETQEH
jgi:hypothetical protein